MVYGKKYANVTKMPTSSIAVLPEFATNVSLHKSASPHESESPISNGCLTLDAPSSSQSLPENEEQVVTQLYPPQTFAGRKVQVEIRHDRIHSSEWREPVYFRDITECIVKTTIFTSVLKLGVGGNVTKIRLKAFRGPAGKLDEVFMSYYGRHVARLASAGKIGER